MKSESSDTSCEQERKKMPMKKRIAAALIVVTAFVLAACGQLK